MTEEALVGVVTPESILQEADRIINGARQEDYGPPEVNFQRIADFWEDYLSMKPEGESLSRKDVAMMMILSKVARTFGSDSRDNYVDIAGYAALGARFGGFGK